MRYHHALDLHDRRRGRGGPCGQGMLLGVVPILPALHVLVSVENPSHVSAVDPVRAIERWYRAGTRPPVAADDAHSCKTCRDVMSRNSSVLRPSSLPPMPTPLLCPPSHIDAGAVQSVQRPHTENGNSCMLLRKSPGKPHACDEVNSRLVSLPQSFQAPRGVSLRCGSAHLPG